MAQSCMEEQEDSRWLDHLRGGDNDAFKLLFERYYAALCAFATGYVEDSDSAEDIVQDVFFKLYTDKVVFDSVVALKSYLYTAVKNQSLNYLKHQRIKQEYIVSREEKEQTTFFFNRIVEQELVMLVTEAMTELPEQTRKVMELVMEGKENPEIAEELGVTIDSVKSHKKRGRQFLKSRLGEIMSLLILLFDC